jgi:hypothetical protein
MTKLPLSLEKWRDRAETAEVRITELKAENVRLNRIIAKDLLENDELGCEYTYVNILRARVKELEAAFERARAGFSLVSMLSDRHFSKEAWVNLKGIHESANQSQSDMRQALGKPAKDNNQKESK